MPSVVIVSAARTAIGTARKGSLANTPPERLAAAVLRAAIERSGFAPDRIDDVILAESLQGGGAIARHAAVEIGLIQAAGMSVNRHCAGSLTSAGIAAGAILSGMERIVVAGGVNSGSMMPRMQQRDPKTGETTDWWLPATHPETPNAPTRDMSITVGWNTAKAMGLTREEQDAWACRSHARAVAAIDAGHFVEQIVPVMAYGPDGQEFEFSKDEHPRRDTTMEKLAGLKILHPEIEGFNVTAGNASGGNDAAVAMVLTSEEIAKAEGSPVLARLLGWTAIGIEPVNTGLVVSKVIEKLLARTGRKQSDIVLYEINEAFASVPVAACKIMGLDEEAVNISGSGCSLGHPVGASGGRMIQTLAHDLRRRGGGLGIAAMCAGGGQGGAVLIEV